MLTPDHENVKAGKKQAAVRTLVHLLAFILIFLVLYVPAFMLVKHVLHIQRYASGENRWMLSMSVSAPLEVAAVVIAYLIVVMLLEKRRNPYELRLSRLPGLPVGMFAGFGVIALCIGILFLTGSYRVIDFNPDYSPWMDIFVMGFCGGIGEEIACRGIIFRLLEEWIGTWGGVLISALLFGLMHLNNPRATLWGALALAIESGALFAAIYAWTRSLWWVIGFHAMWNVAEGPIFGSVVSGLGKQSSWFTASWQGPAILTGGSFGFEASIVPVVVCGLLAVFLLVSLQKRGKVIKPLWKRNPNRL